MNLRKPNLSDPEAQALLTTIEGLPDAEGLSERMTYEQRCEWYRLVISEGMDVNAARLLALGRLK